jgi:hypothetical protein
VLSLCFTAFDSIGDGLWLSAVDVRTTGCLCRQLGHFLLKLKRVVSPVSDLLRAMSIISNVTFIALQYYAFCQIC